MDGLAAWMGRIPWQLVAGAAASLVALLMGIFALRRGLFPKRSDVVERLERTVGVAQPAERAARKDDSEIASFLRPITWLVRPNKAEELSQLRQKLVQAGLRGPHAMEVFLAIKVGLAAILTVAFLQINARLGSRLEFPYDVAVAVWVCGLGFFLPHLFLRSMVQSRQIKISNALPDAMDMLVTCVEAGLGLDAAISRVSQEIGIAAPILGGELNLAFLEIQAGMTRADAFRRLAERTGVDDLRSLSAMLIQTELFGTSVARALRVHSEGMRIRRMQQAEERAAMVGVKMTFPLVMFILPSLMIVVMGPAIISIFEKVIGGK